MKPIVYKLKTEGYDIEIIDVDSNKKLARQYGITSLPTLWVNGTKHTGAKTIDQYRHYMQ
jgi:protein-disulfide isomerase